MITKGIRGAITIDSNSEEDLKSASEFRKYEISMLLDIISDYGKQHRLNLFNTQSSVMDFQESITNLKSIDIKGMPSSTRLGVS